MHSCQDYQDLGGKKKGDVETIRFNTCFEKQTLVPEKSKNNSQRQHHTHCLNTLVYQGNAGRRG